MRIVHVYKDFYPPVSGGMERHMALMCRHQRQWADVEALTCSRSFKSRVIERDGTRVIEVGEWGRFQSAPVSPGFPSRMGATTADLMVVHVPFPTAELGFLYAQPRTKLIVRYQSDVVRQAAAMRLYGPFLQRFLRRADAILVASEQYLETSETLQPHRDKCRVVPLGVEPGDYPEPPSGETERLRKQYGGEFVFFCGRHRYYKGLDVLVRASASLDVPVVIAGDGPQRQKCEVFALKRDLPVRFVGSLPDEALVAHLRACGLFAFPSVARSEAYGIAMLEAHLCGKAVVATKLGTGVEFVNEHGKTGLNVKPNDPDALAAAINELMRAPQRRSEMGAYARSRVLESFTAEKIARAEFEIYEEFVRG
jgi:glycosyltransferase involved in cell wall biosynthesis